MKIKSTTLLFLALAVALMTFACIGSAAATPTGEPAAATDVSHPPTGEPVHLIKLSPQVHVSALQFTFVKSFCVSVRHPGPVPSMNAFGSDSAAWPDTKEMKRAKASRPSDFMRHL